MKYILDVLLVAGLVWIGYLWNGEKDNGLAQAGQIDQLNVQVAKLCLELNQLKDTGAKTAEEMASMKGLMDRMTKDLQDKTDALEAKTAEAEELRTASAALQTRVDELQGYKDLAKKAVFEEKPVPAAEAP